MRLKAMFAVLLVPCCPVLGQVSDSEQPSGREHSIPLFMAHGNADGRQGFIRVINHSDEAGTVRIQGIDDTGMRYGPIELSIGARETKHLNSGDVENGNASKGLSAGLGDGDGDWRLLLHGGDLDVEPLAYIRTLTDGFLTSMHDVVPDVSLRHRVPIFNPGSNTNQESSLRLINPGDVVANVAITGRDDAMVEDEEVDAAGEYRLTIPPGGAQTVKADELETGPAGADGIGDGTGKWSLDVQSNTPVIVMNLMSTPSGHLSNLSGANPSYRDAVGLWKVSFEDQQDSEGFIILLPDSRMYAWLPEADDVNRIARGTFESTPDGITGSGELYESGKAEVVGLTVTGGSDDFEFNAQYRPGDWIRGQYNVVGETARSFHGWAFTGFERGGAAGDVAGLWRPEEEDSDLGGDFTPTADGALSLSFTAASFQCNASGEVGPVNPAFNVYEADVTITCLVLVIPPTGVDLILAVMDPPNMPGSGSRAIALAIVHNDMKIAFGALFGLDPS